MEVSPDEELVEVSPDEELVEVSPDEELVEASPDEELVEASPKNEHAVRWTPLRLVILSVFLASIFGIFITRHGVFLASDLTQKNSEMQEGRTVVSLLDNAKVDAYSARVLIHNIEESYKSKNNNYNLVYMANQWSEFGAKLPYPEALAMALDDKNVRIKLSQIGSNNFNDYKEQLASNRNRIMDPNIETITKAFAYDSYKQDLQDLTSFLQEEIKFQKGEISEEGMARFYKVLEEKRIKRSEENIKIMKKIVNDFEVNSAQ